MSIGVRVSIHLIGYDADGFLQFRVLIHCSESFQRFIYFNKIQHFVGGLIHFIGHIFMMQMDSFNFRFSCSKAHFSSF